MFESLVSSKIRRTLLEYLLAHPQDRVYLRGLAKQLDLSISPLRRELKRLEQLGVLNAYDEANIRFYVVDHTSPMFAQLAAWAHAPQASVAAEGTVKGLPQLRPRLVEVVRPSAPSWQAVVGGVGLSLFVAVVLAGVAYLAYMNQRLLMATHDTRSKTTSAVTVSNVSVSAVPAASGQMRSARWTLVPGSMGAGFNTTRKESY